MTTSTFSWVAMSPPLQRRDMRLVGNAEHLVALDRAIDHVDRVAAQDHVDEGRRRALPALELVLPQQIDELALLGRRKRGEAAAVARLARSLDAAKCRAVEVHVRRAHVQ